MDPLNRKKLRAAEIEAELMKRIASRPDRANVASVRITSTTEQPPRFPWHLSAVVRHDSQVAAHALVEEPASCKKKSIFWKTEIMREIAARSHSRAAASGHARLDP